MPAIASGSELLSSTWISTTRIPTSCASGSVQNVIGTGDEETGAARLAPDALIARARRTVVVIARDELAVFDPQLTVEEKQFFDPGMSMRGIARIRRETHQHADPMPFGVGGEELAFDPGGNRLPCRLVMLPRPRRHQRFPGVLGDALGKAGL